MKRKLLCLFSVLLAVLNVVSLAAAAADTAGNVFLSDSAPVAQTVERDLYWTGGSRTFNGYYGKQYICRRKSAVRGVFHCDERCGSGG